MIQLEKSKELTLLTRQTDRSPNGGKIMRTYIACSNDWINHISGELKAWKMCRVPDEHETQLYEVQQKNTQSLQRLVSRTVIRVIIAK